MFWDIISNRVVESVELFLLNFFELVSWENSEKVPGNIQGFENRSLFIDSLIFSWF
jgi:hypothetical protein